RAGKAQLELVRPISGIDEVRVAIDQPGRDPAAVEGDAVDRIPPGRLLRYRPRERNSPGYGGDRSALDHAQSWTLGRERRQARVEPNGVEPHAVLASPLLSIHKGAAPTIVEPHAATRALFRPRAAAVRMGARCARLGRRRH